jgi:CHAT domain
MPRGAALTLAVADKEGQRKISLFPGDAAVPESEWSVDATRVKNALDELRVKLQQIHDTAGDDLDLDDSRSAKTVDKLLKFSRRVGYGLFHLWPGQLYQAAERHAPGAFNAEVAARVVEVTAPAGFSYPFELIKWRDLPDDWQAPPADRMGLPHEWWDLPVDQRNDPAVRIRALLGMSAIVRRGFGIPVQAADPAASPNEPARPKSVPAYLRNDAGRIENEPVLPMTVFCDPSLTASAREIKYFDDVKPLVDVYGPWPAEVPFTEEAAARYIMNPGVGFNHDTREPVPAMLHLACHCDTTGDIANLHYLRLGGTFGDVTLGDLQDQLMSKEGAEATVQRPLVFLNACGTSVPQLADRTSFTTFLLEEGFRGVLGTFCDISDVVAAHFAVVFYAALLDGKTVGEAMYEARWHLMDVHGNPLGLFYTFYGNVDLKLAAPPVGGVKPACEVSAARRSLAGS